jgi:outer membrane lipoprotein-sorting protein
LRRLFLLPLPPLHPLSLLLYLVASSGCAVAQLNPGSSPDEVLNALHDTGTTIKSFSAKVKLDEYDTVTGAEIVRFGKVWFQIKPTGDPAMHIVFDSKQIGDKNKVPDKVEYLLDDGWLTDRTAATKIESRIQLVPQGQKMNLFQLGKSPFPMPIGQDPAEIQKQFDLAKVAPAKDDPANTIHLLLKPKPNCPMANRFFSVEIWTDFQTRMPVRIQTIDPKQVKERTADLTDLKVNTPLNQTDATLPALPPDWRTSDTPLAP